MNKVITQPWHRESMIRFYEALLPDLLAERLPVGGYESTLAGLGSVRVAVAIDGAKDRARAEFLRLPLPDDDGVFQLEGQALVVVPVADSEDLDRARISCAGDQLLDFIAGRLAKAPGDIQWKDDLLAALLPLDTMIGEFLSETGQVLDTTNWFSRTTHLRRLLNPNMEKVSPDSHRGRVCLLDTPEEHDRVYRVLTIARGASIRDGKLLASEGDDASKLGPTAAAIPFLQHNEPARALIGVNLQRQWLPPLEPEIALVQTGLEPEIPDFWCGHNLLTAFVSLGKDTYEDSIVISRSAADRMLYERPVEEGVRLANRHGQKGVISRILPDEDMPRLPDGTVIDLAYSFIGLHTRMNTGQIFEAAASWQAKATGKAYLCRPFENHDEVLGETAADERPYMLRLTSGAGVAFERKTCVGWVYWGRTAGDSSDRAQVSRGDAGCTRQGMMEKQVLIHSGAFCILREQLTTLSARPVGTNGQSCLFEGIRRRLRAAGISIALSEKGVSFSFAAPEGEVIDLPAGLKHPWISEGGIQAVGLVPGVAAGEKLSLLCSRLGEIAGAPESLRRRKIAQVDEALRRYFDNLLTSFDMLIGSWIRMSGRGMIALGSEISIQEIGLPETIARGLFGRDLSGDWILDAAEDAPEGAEAVIEELRRRMADTWVLVNRAPTMEDTAIVALRPLLVEGTAIRFNPYLCRWLNADFDGDMVAVLYPPSGEAQDEAGRRLSVVAHVEAQPQNLRRLGPAQEALWGLAALALDVEGRRRLKEVLPTCNFDASILTRSVLGDALEAYLRKNGASEAVAKVEELWDVGLAVAARSGASFDPLGLSSLAASLPAWDPAGSSAAEDRDSWWKRLEESTQWFSSSSDFGSAEMGPQLLAARTGARGTEANLVYLTRGRGRIQDGQGRVSCQRRGLLNGLGFYDYFQLAVRTIENIVQTLQDLHQAGPRHSGFPFYRKFQARGTHVLARAMRSSYPGIVFARAAAVGEVDPLVDRDARLFMGLLP